MWQKVTTCLDKMRIPITMLEPNKPQKKVQRGVKYELVPINKVEDYCEGKDGNTTLPMEFNKVSSLEIQNNGACVAIATKEVWESWGKNSLKKHQDKTSTC